MIIEEEIINYWFTDIKIQNALKATNSYFEDPRIKYMLIFPNFLHENKVQQDECLLFLSLYFNIKKDCDECDRIKLTYDT